MAEEGDKSDSGIHHLTSLHAIRSVLRHEPGTVLGLWVDRTRRGSRMRDLIRLAEESGIPVHEETSGTLELIAEGTRHQGVIARHENRSVDQEPDLDMLLQNLQEPPFLLVLDRVQDPHNLGACIRTAECAGVNAVIVPKSGSAPVNDTVRRVSVGATERIPVCSVPNLVRCLNDLKERGIWVIGTSDHAGNSMHQVELSGPVALVFGAESRGMRRLTEEACDLNIQIPMAGTVSSLNVSVAVGVVLFEAVRQRNHAE